MGDRFEPLRLVVGLMNKPRWISDQVTQGKVHWLRQALDEGDIGPWTLTHAEAAYLIEIAEAAQAVLKLRATWKRHRQIIGEPEEWDRLRIAVAGLEATP